MIKCFQLTDADGKVCGVKATGADGSEISFTGKAVLLAAGGLSFKAADGVNYAKLRATTSFIETNGSDQQRESRKLLLTNGSYRGINIST